MVAIRVILVMMVSVPVGVVIIPVVVVVPTVCAVIVLFGPSQPQKKTNYPVSNGSGGAMVSSGFVLSASDEPH